MPPPLYLTRARRMLTTKASRNRRIIRGIFQLISLLKAAPHFGQTRSLLGTVCRHRPQGRRGAVVSRPHEPHTCAAADAPQNGHARTGKCAAAWPPGGDRFSSEL